MTPHERLAQMEALMPWPQLAALTLGHDASGTLTALTRLVRLAMAQRVHGYSDEAFAEALRTSPALRRFAGLDDALTLLPDAAAHAEFERLLHTEPLAVAALSRLHEVPPRSDPPREATSTRAGYQWRFA